MFPVTGDGYRTCASAVFQVVDLNLLIGSSLGDSIPWSDGLYFVFTKTPKTVETICGGALTTGKDRLPMHYWWK